MMRLPLGLPVVMCCLALAGAAQQGNSKRQPPPGPLESVSVQGNKLYAAGDIVRESGLKIGERVDKAAIDAARVTLQASEFFNGVSFQYTTGVGTAPPYKVTFEVQENEQTFPIRFDRFDVPQDKLRACLKDHVTIYADRIPGTEGVLSRYQAAVETCLAGMQKETKVRASISNDDPQQLAVLFAPAQAAPTISQVEVGGNQAVDTGTILRAVNQVAVGEPLSDTRLKLILEGAIKPLYAAKGYAAVSFPKIETEPSKTNLGVVVKVWIKDGPQFKFGSIRFRGQGLDEDEIRSTIAFKPGQMYNSEQADNFRLDLIKKMKRRGMLDAQISVEPEPDEAKRVVNVIYNVTPGAVYNFQKLDIQGLDLTSQPVIEKLWGEKPGHPFNPDYPDFFLKRVQQEGMFDNLADTRSDYSADPSTHDVTVHLYFKGGKSAKDKEREKKEQQDKQQSDGTWNPYPQLR